MRGARLQQRATPTPFAIRPASAGRGPLAYRDVNRQPLASLPQPAKKAAVVGVRPETSAKQCAAHDPLLLQFDEERAALASTLSFPPKYADLTTALQSSHDTLASWPGLSGSPKVTTTQWGQWAHGATTAEAEAEAAPTLPGPSAAFAVRSAMLGVAAAPQTASPYAAAAADDPASVPALLCAIAVRRGESPNDIVGATRRTISRCHSLASAGAVAPPEPAVAVAPAGAIH